MSSKQGHESYTDNIKVKISEKFKPPPKINLAMTYAQRLTLNKQTQDNIPKYEFALEKSVLDKMKVWKSIRTQVVQDRQMNLEKCREEFLSKEQGQIEQEQVEEVELKTVNETGTVVNPNLNPASPTFIPNQSYPNYSTNSNILVPTQVSNTYSNILTPIPLQSYSSQPFTCKQVDKSPFNISDFENDTSSPFDNMELKSINDMEELAQVLNRDGKTHKPNQQPMYSGYQNVPPTVSTPQVNYGGYISSQYSYHIPNSTTYQQQPSSTDYSRTNGYYYPDTNCSRHHYQYCKPSTIDYGYTSSVQDNLSTESRQNCKSVPDIVKALENELENTRLSEATVSVNTRHSTTQTNRPKSTDLVYPRSKIKGEEMDEVLDSLSMVQRELCKAICSMGFPLSRVARTCKMIGDDQKKIVDHLLALSDLLDLGFSEKDVSAALAECDNDRDKALDKLIS